MALASAAYGLLVWLSDSEASSPISSTFAVTSGSCQQKGAPSMEFRADDPCEPARCCSRTRAAASVNVGVVRARRFSAKGSPPLRASRRSARALARASFKGHEREAAKSEFSLPSWDHESLVSSAGCRTGRHAGRGSGRHSTARRRRRCAGRRRRGRCRDGGRGACIFALSSSMR